MDDIYQARTFLLLADDNAQTIPAKRILASPLELARDLVTCLFEEDFQSLEDALDSIKKFAAGINRTATLAPDYATARYYSLMFSFHQFFHSSYRARQGKVLEEVFKTILREHTQFSLVPDSVKKEMLPLLEKSFGKPVPHNDIDVMGVNPQSHKMIVMQLRSRDDTGGTTAKGSLVDLLRGLLRLKVTPKDKILYLICVWDQRDAQQRESTIEKIYHSLKDHTPLDRKAFEQIGKGIPVAKRITLKMAYGTDEILQSVFDWDDPDGSQSASAVRDIVQTIESWDDLWVAYALASLEIDTFALRNVSNIRLLNQKFSRLGLAFDFKSYAQLCQSIDLATQRLVTEWKEDSLPVRSPGDQSLYIRDLLFLKAIYERARATPPPTLAEPRGTYRQSPLLDFPRAEITGQPEPVSFRALIPEITDTNYLTHGLFYYPAKFIPQVVRYCIREFTPYDGWVIDPFAGSGTVGLEALLCERNAILLDLNPLLQHIVALKMRFRRTDLDATTLQRQLAEMRSSAQTFHPDWSNLAYWYPPQMLETLSRYWGWQKQLGADPYALVIESALLKASKQFSYAEHKTPKLFKSKTKAAEIAARLQQDWHAQLDAFIAETALENLTRAQQLAATLAHNHNQVVTYTGIDSATWQPAQSQAVDCLISSPPYLQAQEYIRTSKLELYWLGHTEAEIKQLSRLEIPYRKTTLSPETPTLNAVRANLTRPDLRALLDAYFGFTLQAFENAMRYLRGGGTACIFVGNPRIDGIEVATWRVFAEYFGERGWTLQRVLEDRIKNRQLFGRRKNKNPEGMKSEFLIVLKKN